MTKPTKTLENLMSLRDAKWNGIWAPAGTLSTVPGQSRDIFLCDIVVETSTGLFQLGSTALEDDDGNELFALYCDRVEAIGTPETERLFVPPRRRVEAFSEMADLSPFIGEASKRAYGVYEHISAQRRLIGVIFETKKAKLVVRCTDDLPEATIGTVSPTEMEHLLAGTEQIPLTDAARPS